MDIGTLIGPTVAGIIGYVPLMWAALTVPLIIGLVVIMLCRSKITAIEKRFAENQE
jgi:hypothetical protein